jgi:hypothetical protein
METITTAFGTLMGLATAECDFYSPAEEDAEGFIRPIEEDTPYLEGVPCMPATGRNTRQDGVVFVALAGALTFETKWSAIDLTEDTRGRIEEDDRCIIRTRNRAGAVVTEAQFIISGVTEYDDPNLGFAYCILNLKEVK